jgi:hypothetical protein
MSYEQWNKAQRAIKPTITFDQLCKHIGVDSLEDFDDFIMRNDETYGFTYKCAIEEGKTEEEAEEMARKAEEDSHAEAYDKYIDAVMSVANELYEEHELTLEPTEKDSLTYRVVPKNNWRQSLDCIRHTINGVGYFEFSSVKELLLSGPYTPMRAVMQHLHWIIDHPRVYGNGTAERMVDRRMYSR